MKLNFLMKNSSYISFHLNSFLYTARGGDKNFWLYVSLYLLTIGKWYVFLLYTFYLRSSGFK